MENKDILSVIENLQKKLDEDELDSSVLEQLGNVLISLIEKAISDPKRNINEFMAYTKVYGHLLALSKDQGIPVDFHSFYMGAGFTLLNLYYILSLKASNEIIQGLKRLANRERFYV